MKPTILHISSDYPDSMQPRKTGAILSLVEATPEYRHVVYSLNRFTAIGGIATLPFGEDRTALAYGALPKGLLWGRSLSNLAAWIIADIKRKNIVPSMVEAHKFTVEGLIGLQIAREFSCPLICDIQGNTDVNILKKKPSFRSQYREIAQKASLVFPFAPWTIEPFEKLAGLSPEKCALLPVMPGLDTLSPAPFLGSGRLLSIFNLDCWDIKNLKGLLRALSALKNKYPHLKLDIYGQGSPDNIVKVQKMIAQEQLAERVSLKGPAKNEALPGIMKHYDAFVMPTLRESYGLVYVESLFSGLPVLYSKNRSIDGYFDAESIGYACNPSSDSDIAAGIEHLLTHEKALKQTIASMQTTGALDKVRRENILATYRQGLQKVLAE